MPVARRERHKLSRRLKQIFRERHHKEFNSLNLQWPALALFIERPDTLRRIRDDIWSRREGNRRKHRSCGLSGKAHLRRTRKCSGFSTPALQIPPSGSCRSARRLRQIWHYARNSGLRPRLLAFANGNSCLSFMLAAPPDLRNASRLTHPEGHTDEGVTICAEGCANLLEFKIRFSKSSNEAEVSAVWKLLVSAKQKFETQRERDAGL